MAGIDSYTKLMLHMNGTDGSTTFTDDSTSAHAMTANGNAQIDTAQSKFGGASGLFDGAGDYLDSAFSSDWTLGSSDFTIDNWVYPLSTSGSYRICCFGDAIADGMFFIGYGNVWSSPSVQIDVAHRNSSNTAYIDYLSSAITMTLSQWHHIAVVRTGNTLLIFFNGVQVGSFSFTTTLTSTGLFLVGARYTTPGSSIVEYLNGNIDELRVSKGVARWTSNFTPPTSEYTTPNVLPFIRYRNASPINKIPSDVLVW